MPRVPPEGIPEVPAHLERFLVREPSPLGVAFAGALSTHAPHRVFEPTCVLCRELTRHMLHVFERFRVHA